MNKTKEKKIKKTIEKLLNKLGINEYIININKDKTTDLICARINTENPNILIGKLGVNLIAIDCLVKKILEKETGERPKFLLDVNNYQKRKIEIIKQKVDFFSNRARYLKGAVEMGYMSPYERMIVHSIIDKEADLTTESIGFGQQRRIKIIWNKTDIKKQ